MKRETKQTAIDVNVRWWRRSSSHERDVAMCYEVGANSYVVKPVSFKDLLGVVNRIEDYWLALNAGPPGPKGIR